MENLLNNVAIIKLLIVDENFAIICPIHKKEQNFTFKLLFALNDIFIMCLRDLEGRQANIDFTNHSIHMLSSPQS